MSSTHGNKGNYDTGADFWRDTAATYGLEEAVIICKRYLDTQLRSDSREENQFCMELFAAMYEDTAGRTDPAKIVYPYSFTHAKDQLEESFYHDSRKRSEACARDIDSAIRDCCYKPNHYNLAAATRKTVAEYGFERVNLVLAHNLQTRGYDGRFSDANKRWAADIDLGDRFTSSVLLNAHPILIDDFARYTREIYAELDAARFALPGRPEQGESVQGYEILRSIQFDNDRGFALARNAEAASPYVCWQFTVEDGQRDYYWGKYSDTEAAAGDSFATRAALYLRDENVREADNYLRATELSTEQNYNMIDGLRNNLAYDKPDLTDGQTHEEIRELAPETLPTEGKPSLLGQLDKLKADAPEHTHKDRSGHSDPER